MSSNLEIQSFGNKHDVEFKLFRFTLWITIAVFGIWFTVAMTAGYTLIIKLTYGVCFFIYSGLLIALNKGASFNILATIYYTLAFIILAFVWLPAGGITGVILLMLVMVFISGLLVLPLPAFLTYILCSLFLVGIYYVIELRDVDSAVKYTGEFVRIRDFGIAGIISMLAIGAALFIFKKELIQDRQRLRKTIEELEIEKEKALSADKAKSDFLATISHEMRTPLNGIVGISELLKETDLDEEQENLLSNLSYSSELLYNLISDILDVTLIESGKLVFLENEIEIEKDIQKLVEIVKPRLSKKENPIKIIIDHDSAIPGLVIGDVLRFRQVLLNLINNAIKFTNEGSISISSELIESSKTETKVRFTVSDTGMGISEKRQSELFNKFYKASLDSNIEGTGLGLSICKNLVTLMRGSIGFESKEGYGSTFYFEIPFKNLNKERQVVKDKELKEKPLQEIKVLIAEDVRINQVVIKKMVESLGLKSVEVVENGEQAFQKVKEDSVDVILMDIQMPVMGGLEASSLITDYCKGVKKPIIIAVTANALVSDQEEFMKSGIDGYVTKPITKESLRQALETFI